MTTEKSILLGESVVKELTGYHATMKTVKHRNGRSSLILRIGFTGKDAKDLCRFLIEAEEAMLNRR